MTSRRVVVTGMGAATSLGLNVADSWTGIVAGRSGLKPITRFDPTGFLTRFAGEVTGFEGDSRHDRWTNFALAAAREAIGQAGLTGADPPRIAVLIGTALGAVEEIEASLRSGNPRWLSPTAAADAIAEEFRVTGPVLTYQASFTGSANAIGEAMTMIRTGRTDVVIAGGAEAAITPSITAGFIAMGATSQSTGDPTRAVKPFAADRDGCALGEGSAILILEERDRAMMRAAPILAEVAGYGTTADAFHVVALPDDGDAIVRAMRLALTQASIEPDQIDYINAHGTGTTMNDLVETIAMKQVFRTAAGSIPITSTKPATGHLLGAAGALEAAIGILAMVHGVVPPTLNLNQVDPACDLDYVPRAARNADLKAVMSNSMGFGGHATSLIFRQHVE